MQHNYLSMFYIYRFLNYFCRAEVGIVLNLFLTFGQKNELYCTSKKLSIVETVY